MKKSKFIILIAVIVIISIISFMVYDFFGNKSTEQTNVYEYNIEDLKQIDSSLVKYSEIQQIKPNIEGIKALAIDKNDNLYISGSNKILIYNKDANLLKEFTHGKEVLSMTISPDSEIYLGARDHIEIWNKEGNLINSWKVLNEKVLITSIVVTDSSVFVADAGNKIVYHYNLKGEFLNEIGRKDSIAEIPGFIIPSPYFDLAINSNEELWVANPGRHSFESYTPEGRLISSWERTSMEIDGFSGCCNPSHFAFLSDGSYVTSEKGIVRIKIHNQAGDFKCVVATPNQFDDDTKGLDLAVDSKDRIFVLDPKKVLIRIFGRK